MRSFLRAPSGHSLTSSSSQDSFRIVLGEFLFSRLRQVCSSLKSALGQSLANSSYQTSVETPLGHILTISRSQDSFRSEFVEFLFSKVRQACSSLNSPLG